jgi:hypothetical protein
MPHYKTVGRADNLANWNIRAYVPPGRAAVARGADCGRVCVSGLVAALARPGGSYTAAIFFPLRAGAICAAGRAARMRGDTHAFFPGRVSVCPGRTGFLMGFWCSWELWKGLFFGVVFVGVRGVAVFHVEHFIFSCKQNPANIYNLLRRTGTKKIAPEGARAR